MEGKRAITLIIGSGLILFGYFRLISDENGQVNLNSFRFTGGLFTFVSGMLEGARDLLSRDLTRKAVSTLSIGLGGLLLYLGFSNWA